jgi:hypothetical protein
LSDGTHCVKRRRQKITEFLAKHPAIGLFPCRQRVLLGETKEGAGVAGGLGLAIYPNLDNCLGNSACGALVVIVACSDSAFVHRGFRRR